ncbi:MAG: hypothetical protein KGI71_02610 [Patescibacteria group bacterium]|nr:hypothetical protein [Patescibacteria group bacterium]
MNIKDFDKAKSYLARREIVDFAKDLEKYLEAVITLKGHAWCMDVKAERQKMAKLIVRALAEL